ncbi:MAG: hypothetical protein WBA73_11570, partial [Devosia sp.]
MLVWVVRLKPGSRSDHALQQRSSNRDASITWVLSLPCDGKMQHVVFGGDSAVMPVLPAEQGD